MPTSRAIKAMALTCAVIATLALAAAMPAGAAQPQHRIFELSPDEVQATRDHWTPERLAKVTSGRHDGVSAPSPVGAPERDAVAKAKEWNASGDPALQFQFPASQVGKVIFQRPDGTDDACAGSVVLSSKKMMLATAGHCVWDLKTKTQMKNLAFVPGSCDPAKPGYTGCPEPLYVWPVDKTAMAFEFFEQGNLFYDFAFMTVHVPTGQSPELRLQTVTAGGLGIIFDTPSEQDVWAFAYPTVLDRPDPPPFLGKRLMYCNGGTKGVAGPDSGELAMVLRCDMRDDVDGGPIIVNFNDPPGQGTLVAILSVFKPGQIAGPMLNQTAAVLYESLDNA